MTRNVQFLKDYVNVTLTPRTIMTPITFPDGYLASGDLLAISRLDGLGTLEDWGTGAETTHIAALFDMDGDGKLDVVESTDKTSFWPYPNIQRNPYDEWITLAMAANYSVIHLPLKPEMRAIFNEQAAREFISSSLGLQYGYQSFVASFLDTTNGNLPYPASWQLVEVLGNLLTTVAPDFLNLIFADGANMRLGTTNLTLIQAADLAATKGLSFGELLALPEQDSYLYDGKAAMVCDVFYCRIAKAGGLFGDLTDQINCGEFQNLDVYRLAFYDLDRVRPQACVEADPEAKFCQIMGRYALPLVHASTMTPYAHMNEHCTALPLGYERSPANC